MTCLKTFLYGLPTFLSSFQSIFGALLARPIILEVTNKNQIEESLVLAQAPREKVL